jgi:hypothetical protein
MRAEEDEGLEEIVDAEFVVLGNEDLARAVVAEKCFNIDVRNAAKEKVDV